MLEFIFKFLKAIYELENSRNTIYKYVFVFIFISPFLFATGAKQITMPGKIPVEAMQGLPCPPWLDLHACLSLKTVCFLICWLDLGR